MRVKRYVANTMQEAIAMVKADFGPDAVILHAKRFRSGWLCRLTGRSKVEVVAAADVPAIRGQRVGAHPRMVDRAARDEGQGAASREHAAARELARVRAELDSVKERLRAQQGPAAAPGMPAALRSLRERLAEQELQSEFLDEIVTAVMARAAPEHLEDEAWLRREVHREVAAGVSCADPWDLADEAQVQCLVGPTGVGKTTTIAKLAANYALLAQKKVALITVDTYRIAAVEQLKTYAEIIGVPVDVAFTPQDLKEAFAKRRAYDLILVDTAGRSQKNKMQMAELRALLEVFDSPLIHLVVSATTRQADMLDIAQSFSALRFSYLIVTKLDETSTYGALYNLCRITGKSLSYLTNGQSVPDDIEVAEATKVADMILGG